MRLSTGGSKHKYLISMDTERTVNFLRRERLMWIDWMKAIGIYLIVVGHFFPVGYRYVYAFSVPLFFVVSGFLTKREENVHLFWKKLWFNMIIPMVIICAANFLINSIVVGGGEFISINRIIKFFLWIILGFHKGLNCLWFVYTLVCLKLILQFSPHNKIFQLFLFIVIPIVGIWIDAHPMIYGRNIVAESNALINTTVAYPFFIAGYYLRRWKNLFSRFHNLSIEVIGVIIAIIILIVGAKINQPVWMYKNGYGSNFMLFLLDGFCGTFIVFIISRWLGNRFGNAIVTISKGTIIILGFHIILITFANRHLPVFTGIQYLYSFIIVLIFIPIIRFSERYLPYVIGKFRV